MKILFKYTILMMMVAIMMFSCNPDDASEIDEEKANAVIEALQGTWTASEVRKDQTVISDFENFSITITDKSYSTENGSPVWPQSGTFDVQNAEVEDEFIREDGRLFTANVNNGILTLVIVYQEETGRGEYGTYEFVMN
ncbi:hypothetical protein QYS48_12180 [Marivirga arenosa]|uniref:Lipocalin-like domain-containing protein n=1 Tax=Marivirga arenosa TaxID=3059076 RepID=A0AA49GJG8_9BACT|nr:hypothetical protein [Marivirga sp. ABR2-2]WKK87425.1 hypothetical protein QYS48_12180 [Marivirga sp. ABR2-2]